MALGTFLVPEGLAGKTLEQAVREGQGGRADVLGGFLGVDPRSPLTAGQRFTIGDIPGVDPAGSSELQFVQRAFTPAAQAEQQQQQDFVQEQEGRFGDFVGRVQQIPEQIAAKAAELGVPEAFRERDIVSQAIRELPQAIETGARGELASSQMKARTARDIAELVPGLEAAQAGLQSRLGEFRASVEDIFTPFQIEAGMLGDQIARRFDLFKTNINANLERDLAELGNMNAIQLQEMANSGALQQLERQAEIAEATQSGEFRDLGDRVALINPLTGNEVASFDKGLTPTRGEGVDPETAYNNAIANFSSQVNIGPYKSGSLYGGLLNL